MCQPKITAKKRAKYGSECPSKIPCFSLPPGERGHCGQWTDCNGWPSEFVLASINIDLQNVQRSPAHQFLGSFSAKFSQYLLRDNDNMITMSQKTTTTTTTAATTTAKTTTTQHVRSPFLIGDTSANSGILYVHVSFRRCKDKIHHITSNTSILNGVKHPVISSP